MRLVVDDSSEKVTKNGQNFYFESPGEMHSDMKDLKNRR